MVEWNSDILAVLRRAGLLELGPPPPMVPLTGGVSSDIWHVQIGDRAYCVKRALSKLKVDADWRAPVERSQFEAAWMAEVALLVPTAVPPIIYVDERSSAIVMRYLDPKGYKLWKDALRDGEVDLGFAAKVGWTLAEIHQKTANREEIKAKFASDTIFHSIRLEPYLLATAQKHRSLAKRLKQLARQTAQTKVALVHGDASPKNILVGPAGPVFLDAECAWYGDPVFDLAFCLNHMLLKCVWRPNFKDAYLASFDAMSNAYLNHVAFEEPEALEARTASLLPGLLLGRIDGKSPVEYIEDPQEKDRVRRIATAFLAEPSEKLASIRDVWKEEFT